MILSAVNIYDPHKYARLPDNIEVDGNLLGTSDGKTIGQRRKQIREQAFSNEKLTKRQRDIKVLKNIETSNRNRFSTQNTKRHVDVVLVLQKFNRRSSSSDVSAEEGSKSVSDDSPTRSQTVADSAGDDDYSPKSRVRKCKKKKRGSRKIGKYLSSTYGSTALDDGITFDLEEYEKRYQCYTYCTLHNLNLITKTPFAAYLRRQRHERILLPRQRQ